MANELPLTVTSLNCTPVRLRLVAATTSGGLFAPTCVTKTKPGGRISNRPCPLGVGVGVGVGLGVGVGVGFGVGFGVGVGIGVGVGLGVGVGVGRGVGVEVGRGVGVGVGRGVGVGVGGVGVGVGGGVGFGVGTAVGVEVGAPGVGVGASTLKPLEALDGLYCEVPANFALIVMVPEPLAVTWQVAFPLESVLAEQVALPKVKVIN